MELLCHIFGSKMENIGQHLVGKAVNGKRKIGEEMRDRTVCGKSREWGNVGGE